MADTILLLLILGAAAHQAAFLVITAVLFDDFRAWVARRFGPTHKLTYLSRCHLCISQWSSMLAAAVAVQRFDFTGVLLVDWALLSFTVAVVARFILEVWALASSGVSLLRATIDRPQTIPAPQNKPTRRRCDSRQSDPDAGLDHLLLWVGVPRDFAPKVGDSITERGISYEVMRVTDSPADGVNVEAEPYFYGDMKPTRLLVIPEGGPLPTGTIMAAV